MSTASSVAIVTGGSRGLGASLVTGFLDRGYRVAAISRGESAFVSQLLADRPETFYWTPVDARDLKALADFAASVVRRFGRIDALVNNAGAGTDGMLPLMRPRDIADVIALNLTAAIALTQSCSRAMLRQGSGCIINISSINAVRGHSGVAAYSASKAGLDGFTRSLARELGPRNIRVNSLAPGYFDSEMVAGLDDASRQRIARRTPLGRLATIDEIAKAAFFLASEEASFITGQILVVDGGITC
jgi:3-oxoacyl-[acyl-carrier protein] reductase